MHNLSKADGFPTIAEISFDNMTDIPEGRHVWSCIQCGMCAGTCPHGEYMQYSPRRIISMLRRGDMEEVFQSDSLLQCVTCYACMHKCSMDIKLTELLLPLVKEQMFEHLEQLPPELQDALQNILRYGNPHGYSPRKRTEWLANSEIPIRVLHKDPRPAEILWIPESYLAFHPRGQDCCHATARIFHALGDDFAILGNEERSLGESARLVGESGLFDMLRERNTGIFAKYKFDRIVTSGAHAYDAMRHLYPAYGFDYPLDHTTTYFARRLPDLKPQFEKQMDLAVTYHDSCVLGRHNGFYDEPRTLLSAIPGVRLVEMTHNRDNALCCGGGGGGMWLDTYYKEKGMKRLSDRRVEEAIATGADILAVSCPYEVSRFEDSLKLLGHENRMKVLDVAEIVAEAIGK